VNLIIVADARRWAKLDRAQHRQNVAQLHPAAGLRVQPGDEQQPQLHLQPAFDGRWAIESGAACATGRLAAGGMARLGQGHQHLGQLPLFIDDSQARVLAMRFPSAGG